MSWEEYRHITDRLRGVVTKRWGKECFCPIHEADGRKHKRSLTLRLSPEGHLWIRCCRGCGFKEIIGALGVKESDCFKKQDEQPRRSSMSDMQGAEATYDYKDESGRLLFQVVRFPGKKFCQRHKDANGKWVWGMEGVRRVLYRLPELIASGKKRRVFIVEGEKDCDRLTKLGLIAVTNPMGAGASKWRDEYNEFLRDCHVVIIPDNDPIDEKLGYRPGLNHAEAIFAALKGVAASITMLMLDGLPEKGDVSDWLDQGHTKNELIELVQTKEPDYRKETPYAEEKSKESQAEGRGEGGGAAGAEASSEQAVSPPSVGGDFSSQKLPEKGVDGKLSGDTIEGMVIAAADRLAARARTLDPEDWLLVAEGVVRELKRRSKAKHRLAA